MMSKIVLNRDKSIGKVVFIVEGDKKEHSLLGYVFKEILDYSVVDVKRNHLPYVKYVSKHNIDSRIFIVSAESSNIKSAGCNGKDYLDKVFSTLYNEYSLDITNAAVYYIFDRDNESNLFCDAEKLVGILRNSRDNGFESNGLLLLSYPCIESYIKMCVDSFQMEMVDSPKSLKKRVSAAEYQYSKLKENSLIRACNNMLLGIRAVCERDLKEADLDNFEEINYKVLSEENKIYLEKRQYILLSLLSIAFIDLGILRLEI